MAQCPHGQTLKYGRELQSGSIKWINPGYSIVLLHGNILEAGHDFIYYIMHSCVREIKEFHLILLSLL